MGIRSAFLAATALLVTSPLCMADIASGKINLLEFNYGFAATRVYLTNVTTMCSGSASNFAYIAPADGANYNAMAASLLTAKALASTVDLYSQVDTNGYCHIYDIVFH